MGPRQIWCIACRVIDSLCQAKCCSLRLQPLLYGKAFSHRSFKNSICPEVLCSCCRIGSSCRASSRNQAQERQEASQTDCQDDRTQGHCRGAQRSRCCRAEQGNQEDQGRQVNQRSARSDQAEGQEAACHGQSHGNHLLPELDALLVS